MKIKVTETTTKTTTSKKLTWGVFILWAFSIIASYVLSYFDFETGYLVTATTTSLGIVLSGYFSKSYFENKEKYGNRNNQENIDSNNDSELGC